MSKSYFLANQYAWCAWYTVCLMHGVPDAWCARCMVAQVYNPSTWEVAAGEPTWASWYHISERRKNKSCVEWKDKIDRFLHRVRQSPAGIRKQAVSYKPYLKGQMICGLCLPPPFFSHHPSTYLLSAYLSNVMRRGRSSNSHHSGVGKVVQAFEKLGGRQAEKDKS